MTEFPLYIKRGAIYYKVMNSKMYIAAVTDASRPSIVVKNSVIDELPFLQHLEMFDESNSKEFENALNVAKKSIDRFNELGVKEVTEIQNNFISSLQTSTWGEAVEKHYKND
jgi:hypothetical protein